MLRRANPVVSRGSVLRYSRDEATKVETTETLLGKRGERAALPVLRESGALAHPACFQYDV